MLNLVVFLDLFDHLLGLLSLLFHTVDFLLESPDFVCLHDVFLGEVTHDLLCEVHMSFHFHLVSLGFLNDSENK